ncbi:lipopolysaccharide biosynthesis protein [Flavobacteriaceae bacterium]|nr:lipopolysaccharide biosynthesis protein [Flavobacteriaceae bacterium]
MFQGMLWTFADMFIIKGIAFIAGIYLARVLGPEEFGLIGMISIFIAIGTSLVESGLSSSIIRASKVDKTDFSTVFYVNMVMSVLTYLIIYISAPLIAKFYNQEILIDVIRLFCISFLITGLSSVQLAILNKKMLFKTIAYYNVPATITGIIVGIYLGLNNYGVWSLVWMHIATKIVLSFLLWLNSDWKPGLDFSLHKLKYHYSYGYKLLLAGLLNKFYLNLYNIIIGKYFSIQTIGWYERSSSYNNYSSDVLTGIIKKVTFPLLSNIKKNKIKLSEVYKKILGLTILVSAPIMIGLAAIAEPLFLFFLGEEWLPAVVFFQILSIASVLYPIHSLNLNILKVYGRSDLFLKLEVYKKIITTACIVISFQFGIIGLVWSSVIASIISLLINTKYSGELINYNTKSQLYDMLPVCFITFVTGIIMMESVFLLNEFPHLLQITITGFIGLIFYISINYIMKVKAFMYAIELIKQYKK